MSYMPLGVSDLDFGSISGASIPGMTGGGLVPINPSFSSGSGGGGGIFGTGMSMDTAKLALSGLGTLANLYGGFQSLGLAKKQFNFTKDFAEKNMANQIQTYNTALADRARSRYAMEGTGDAAAQAYIDQNSLGR